MRRPHVETQFRIGVFPKWHLSTNYRFDLLSKTSRLAYLMEPLDIFRFRRRIDFTYEVNVVSLLQERWLQGRSEKCFRRRSIWEERKSICVPFWRESVFTEKTLNRPNLLSTFNYVEHLRGLKILKLRGHKQQLTLLKALVSSFSIRLKCSNGECAPPTRGRLHLFQNMFTSFFQSNVLIINDRKCESRRVEPLFPSLIKGAFISI